MNKQQAAIKYAKRGYYVLPMNGKQPLVKFKNRPPLTIDQIKNYWRKYPNANIALRTIDFFVVDIDTKEAHGVDGMKSYQVLKNTGLIIPTLAQRTASGGIQLFYKKPPNTDIKQVIGLKDGIDVKARVNNYVVVPPSTTNRGEYQWLNKLPISEPKPSLIEFINNHEVQTKKAPNWSKYQAGKKWTGIVLDNLVKGAPEGQRNDYMTRLCGQMIHAGADDNNIWELLQFANQHNQPPLSNQELERVFTSILREELSKYGKKSARH